MIHLKLHGIDFHDSPLFTEMSQSPLEQMKPLFSTSVTAPTNALGRITNYMSLEKRRIVMKTFIASQFNYCPLIWMFHSRTINNKINRLHERAIRIVFTDF